MAILPVSLALPSKLSLSSFSSISDNLSLSLSSLSLRTLPNPRTTESFTVRMGGGPRTFPGGVSKWQWKRMQQKKATQLLKARLMRERQIYEMRKRAELKAAVSELERPWEVVEKAAPTLFSVGADEQVKVLADRFQKPGGFDLWTDNDGPQLFETPDGLPTARFFPKGVVHSIKPYGRVHFDEDLGGIEDEVDGFGMKLIRGSNSGFEDSVEESSHFSNSRVSSDADHRQSGQRNIDRLGSGSRRDGDRNPSRRFSEAKDSDEKSSYSSNSRVSSGVNRDQIGQRSIDQKGNGRRRDGDRNPSRRFSEAKDSDEKSSYSSNSRVSSGVNRDQIGQRSIDQKGNGRRRVGDRNLNGRFGESRDSDEKSSYSSNSRGFSSVNRHQSDQRSMDKKGSGGRHDGDFRKPESRSVGSRQLASNPREQRNNSRAQIGGYNRSRRDSKLEKGRSSFPEDVYDMSLRTDGSYGFGSS